MAADQSRAARGDREGAQHGVPHAPPRGTRPGAQQGGGAEPRGGPEEPAGTTRGPDGDAAGPDGEAMRDMQVRAVDAVRDHNVRLGADATWVAVSHADVIVANLDGMDVDAGTAWELGFAHGLGKHVVGVYTDWRLHFKWQTVNLMIQCSVDKLVSSLDELEEYLQHFAADAKVAS